MEKNCCSNNRKAAAISQTRYYESSPALEEDLCFEIIYEVYMMKQLQNVTHVKEKKYQDSFQVDCIVINLTMYLTIYQTFDELTKKGKFISWPWICAVNLIFFPYMMDKITDLACVIQFKYCSLFCYLSVKEFWMVTRKP